MPLNCPRRNEFTRSGRYPFAPPYICDETCGYYSGDKCRYHSPVEVPLADILTEDERITRLERIILKIEKEMDEKVPTRVLRALRSSMDALKGEMRHLTNNLNEHIDLAKKKKKKAPRSKGGTVDV
jgi:hypothetical protein